MGAQESRHYTIFYTCSSDLKVEDGKAILRNELMRSCLVISGAASDASYAYICKEIIKQGKEHFPDLPARIDCIIDHGFVNPEEVKPDSKPHYFEVIAQHLANNSFVTTETIVEGPHAHFHGTIEFLHLVNQKITGRAEIGVIINAVRRIK